MNIRKEPFIMYIDCDEKKPWNFRRSDILKDIKSKRLKHGDYTIEGLDGESLESTFLMIERKAGINELTGNLGKAASKKRLRDHFINSGAKYKFLIIEDSLKGIMSGSRYSKLNNNFVPGWLISLMAKEGVHVIFAGNRQSAQKYARHIMKKVWQYYLQDQKIKGLIK